MRDEYLRRDWADHHQSLSQDLSRAFGALRLGLGRFWAWDGSTAHLLALVASLAITGLTFNHTA